MKSIDTFAFVLILSLASVLKAECPLDHLVVGCNEDGIWGTADDGKLFVDSSDKYRNSGTPQYLYWYYPLSESVFPSYRWRIGEPGFGQFQCTNPAEDHSYDPNRGLAGVPGQDYGLIVECLAISPGLMAVHKDYPAFTIDQAGQWFDYSYIHALLGEPHMHMSFQAEDGESLFWITWRIYDQINDVDQYAPSEPFTVVFNAEPVPGDLAVDGVVDAKDLAQFCRYWLERGGAFHNDYYERADADRDGKVGLADFAALASNWQGP